MKLIPRISIILAAAFIVVGLAFGLSKTSYVQSLVPTQSFEHRPMTTTSTDSAQATADMTTADTTTENSTTIDGIAAQPDFAGEHNEPSGLFGLLQVGQNLGIMSLIVLPFAIWPWFFNRGKKVHSSHCHDNFTIRNSRLNT